MDAIKNWTTELISESTQSELRSLAKSFWLRSIPCQNVDIFPFLDTVFYFKNASFIGRNQKLNNWIHFWKYPIRTAFSCKKFLIAIHSLQERWVFPFLHRFFYFKNASFIEPIKNWTTELISGSTQWELRSLGTSFWLRSIPCQNVGVFPFLDTFFYFKNASFIGCNQKLKNWAHFWKFSIRTAFSCKKFLIAIHFLPGRLCFLFFDAFSV